MKHESLLPEEEFKRANLGMMLMGAHKLGIEDSYNTQQNFKGVRVFLEETSQLKRHNIALKSNPVKNNYWDIKDSNSQQNALPLLISNQQGETPFSSNVK